MNSKRIFFRLVVLSLFISACAPKGEWLTEPPQQEPETNLRFDINGGTEYLCTDSGVYYTTWAKDYACILLMYYDIDSRTATPVCEERDCRHVGRDCGARLSIAGGYLYADPLTGDIYIYNATNSVSNDLFGIYRVEKLSGKHRTVLCTIGDGVTDGGLIFGDKGIYLLMGRRDDSYRYNESFLIVDYDGNMSPGPALGVMENLIARAIGGQEQTRFIRLIHTGENIDDIYTVDINTGRQSLVYKIDFDPANIGNAVIKYGPDGLYIAIPEGDGKKGGIFKISPDGTVNVVAQGVSFTHKTWDMNFMDGYIILREYLSNLNYPSDIQVISLADGSMKNISSLADSKAYKFLGATKDYILVNYYARPGQMEYGLIPKADWLAGEEHIEITIK